MNTEKYNNEKLLLTSLKVFMAKYRRHTDPNGEYDQNEMKRNKALNYFKQNCPIFQFAIKTFLRG